jgi:putative phosphoesterase
MIVGIFSDTHGHAKETAAALAVLRGAGAEFYIHCGDVGGEAILDLMAGLPLAFVFGNTDMDREELAKYAGKLGLGCHDEFADLTLDGKRIAVTHGDNGRIIQQIVSGKQHQYLLHGHTHVARDQTIGGLRYINPGAVHRTPRPSVATLDTKSDKVRFIHLEKRV